MVVVPAAIEGAALSVALVPFVLHRWDMYRWDRDHRHQHVPKGKGHEEALTVLLPVWNEAHVIEKKLTNLAAQNLPVNLLLIDSASTDDTVARAKEWFAVEVRLR